jgi:hypothetical protein
MTLALPPEQQVMPFFINAMLTSLGYAVPALIANGDVAGCIASAMHATKRERAGIFEYRSADNPERRNSEEQLCKLLLREPLASVMADTLRSRFDADGLTASAPALLKRYRQYLHHTNALRLGDLAALTAQLPLTPTAADWQSLTATIAAHLKANRLESKTIASALDVVGRADLAAALVALHHSTLRIIDSAAALDRLLLALDRHELRHRLAHHGWTCSGQNAAAKALISACALTTSVWDAAGEPVLTVADTSYIAHRTFLAKSKAGVGVAPAAAVVDSATFERRWRALTGGIFDDFDWRYAVAAGGAVVACLDPQVDVTAAEADAALRPKDVDLFIHGLTPNGVTEVCAAIEMHAKRFTELHPEAGGYMTLLTSNTMTIIFGNPALPRVQVPLGFWWSVEDVLVTADVDCCCVAYDGSTVVASARGMVAWTHRCNTGLDSHNAVRGSPTYEMRLWKYAQRHGFGVYVATATDGELSELRRELAAIPRSKKTARQMTTSACGLRWIAAVDAGLVTPTVPVDPLALANGGRTLAELRSAFEAEGYIASDDYGNHEAGYSVITDGPDPDLGDRAAHDLSLSCIPEYRSGFSDGVSGAVWGPRTTLPQAVMLKPNDEVAFMPVKWHVASHSGEGIDDEN